MIRGDVLVFRTSRIALPLRRDQAWTTEGAT